MGMQARAGSGSTALTFDHMKHSTARDFTIYHAGGFGIFEPFARNNSYMCVFLPSTCCCSPTKGRWSNSGKHRHFFFFSAVCF